MGKRVRDEQNDGYGYAVEAVVFVLLAALALGAVWFLRHTPRTQTVPQEVYTDGSTQPAPDVTAWAQDELAMLDRDWHLPPHTLAVVSPLSWNGITVIAGKPVKYTVVLVRWAYPDEAQVRNTLAHEFGHVMISEAGLPQTEEMADQFALCFGSPKAREYARLVKHMTADCDQLRQTLTKTAGRP